MFEELVTDNIYHHIVKDTVRYAVSVQNEQELVQPFESRASVRCDGVGHVIARKNVQRWCAQIGCKGKPWYLSSKCNVTLRIQLFAPYRIK
jgi:hypothetical protein